MPSELARHIPDVTLTFVGPAVADTAAHVREVAAARGVEDRVAFTGRLDDDAFVERVARARAGIQLRDATLGEMSGAVADVLSGEGAANFPVI